MSEGVPNWVRLRLFVGCLAACWLGVGMGALAGYVAGAGKPPDVQDLRDALMMGVWFGSFPGLILGSYAVERVDRTRRFRTLWTFPLMSFLLLFVPSGICLALLVSLSC